MSTRARFLLLAGACLGLFVAVAILMERGAFDAFDRSVLASLRLPGAPGTPSFPNWLLDLVSVISPWGTWSDRLVLALAFGAAMLAKGRGREATVIMLSVALAALLLPAAKHLFARDRPDLIWRLAVVDDQAFPSGHAMGAMVLYPMAGFMLGRMGRGFRGALIGLTAGIVLALAIGSTRVLLGVHWTSDAIGGWLLGGAWSFASLALVVRGRQQRTGSVQDRIVPGAAIGQRQGDGDARR